MRWGPAEWSWAHQAAWLFPVVLSTSFAAMGLALLIASLAQTEAQVAVYGTPLVLILAGISGCLMPRDLMPELMKEISLATPHAWALDAYMQLLLSSAPNLQVVGSSCLALLGFGAGFLVLSLLFLKLD
jgi:ABC-type multidrug transport system permease subunit